ncbi:DNA translocase FtsK [Plasticicumulans acidivorans]|uniref:DNA translocase FtsK n=1 Tax=Plasticicumulans acidivorans TaxID=886464 RepID=UPI000D7152DD|nr:DNA translocase FtsK 4TM domain-containing protein [Plasticicumulans acidivorans]
MKIVRHISYGLREVGFLLLAAIAAFLFIALASYTSADPAWTHTGDSSRIANLGGVAGAWFADIAYYFLGYVAFALPLSIAIAGWAAFKRNGIAELDGEIVVFRTVGLLVSIGAGSGLAALHLRPSAEFLTGSAGGIIGNITAHGLVTAFGPSGGTLFLLVLFLAGVTLASGLSWLSLVDLVGRGVWEAGALASRLLALLSSSVIVGRGRDAVETDEPVPAAAPHPVAEASPRAEQVPLAAPGHAVHAEIPPAESLAPELADMVGLSASRSVPQLDAAVLPTVSVAPQIAEIPEIANDVVKRDDDFESDPAPWENTPPPVVQPAVAPVVAAAEGEQSDVADWVIGRPAGKPLTEVAAPVSVPELQVPAAEPVVAIPVPPMVSESAVAVAPIVVAPMPAVAPVAPAVRSELLKPAATSAVSITGGVGMAGDNPPPDTVKSAADVKAAPSEAHAALFGLRPPKPELDPLPSIDLLDEPREKTAGYTPEVLEEMSRLVESKLAEFGIEVRVVGVEPGPVVTRFELDLAAGVKVSQITNLAKDVARGLSVISVRVVEVIPGKSVIGLEIPNKRRQIVQLREILDAPVYLNSTSPLTVSLGVDIGGRPIVGNLAKMPHVLIAGTTGSGKSVAVNCMLISMLYKATADQLRLILIDPKMLELSIYEGIPHLLSPVVTDMKDAANALRWCVAEMERRYRLMAAMRVRNIAGFNKLIEEAIDAGEPIADPLWKPDDSLDDEAPGLEPLPYIVVVIDELADMMMIVGKKVEELIARLAQKARAAGIHLILATQRPSVDVITGLIKANIPTRIALTVASKIDSRTILDQMGAEALLGHGDMLYSPPGTGVPQRVHGAFVDDHEVNAVVEYLRQVGEPDYLTGILDEPADGGPAFPGDPLATNDGADAEQDPLYDQAVRIVVESRRASVSGVQRRLKIGYNRAARLVEEMERAGIVGPIQSNGSREVLAGAPSEA